MRRAGERRDRGHRRRPLRRSSRRQAEGQLCRRQAVARRFAAAARVSEVNKALYQTYLQPVVQATATDHSAARMRDTHPSRLRFAAFSDRSPLASQIESMATAVRADRKPVDDDNPLRVWEKVTSTWISTCWRNYQLVRDAATEATFLAT
ncbi:MAG: DUF3141 domain-containing protein, partial [Methylocystis sp.]|nr:DUF3141 domain-containing protein [Methylocystis sp.]